MTVRERVAVALLVSAIALGVVGDLLFQGRPLGLNAGLFAAGFVLALAVLLRIGSVALHQGRRLMIAPLLLFAGLLAWHDSPLLVATNLLAVAGAVTIGALRRTGDRVTRAEVSDYVVGAAAAGASSFGGAVELLEKDVPWHALARRARGGSGAAVARGLAIGLPLLALFGGLFIAADAVFKSLLLAATPDLGRIWLHVLIACAIAWVSAGLLRDLLAAREEDRLVGAGALAIPRPLRIGRTEIAVALALVDVLFLAFVLVQVRYLFGGEGLVAARAHLTYAHYARHGFFELVAVAVLVVPLLLAANALVPRRSRLVQALSGVLIALVFVVMASALERMRLYQREYGLSELRIYVTGVILWLAVVFVWMAVTVVRGRPRTFAFGAVLAGFAATIALNAVNPDALIARTNLARPHVDTAYLGSLSDDAVPALLQRLPALDPSLRRPLARALLARSETDGSWLAWNASRARATALLTQHRPELVRYATP